MNWSRTVVMAGSIGVFAVLSVAGARCAFAFWTKTDSSNPGYASGDAIPQGSTPTSATPTPNTNSTTVTVVFPAAVTLNGTYMLPSNNYTINQYPAGGGTVTARSATCSGTTTITCAIASVPDGSWTYTDTPFYGANWVGPESAPSSAVTVDSTAPTATVAYPANGTTYGANWTGTISGTASDASGIGSVAVAVQNTTTGKWWNGSAFAASSAVYAGASGTTSWTYGLAASNLASNNSYAVVTQTTDAVGNIGTSGTTSFTYSTSAVTVAFSYPASGTTYGANWTGTITGTAASPNTVTQVQITIKNTTTGKWWDGSTFAATSATTFAATGTTSWSYSLAASSLVSGNAYSLTAQAQDSVGTSSSIVTDPFTYNTTTPVPSVTNPVNSASYGANWTGSITGTATFTNTANNVQLAIENTTSALWWNGTSFAASSQTFVTASGTTSFSYPLAASKLTTGNNYSVVAVASDRAGNMGASSTYSFSYSTAAPTATVAYPVSNSITYGTNWSGSVTGTATYVNPPSYVTLIIKDSTSAKYWNGSSFSATSSTTVRATGTTSWSNPLPASALTTAHTYTVVARAYDTLNNSGVSATRTFKYNTSPPTATVTYPVSATTYGPNWTGTIKGTAVFANGTGSVSIAIQDTTAGLWWNGASFTATSQAFVAATGTTSWSYALAASTFTSGDSYSVIAAPIDAVSNTGASSTYTFTYSTASPSGTISYPVASTTYGANWSGAISGAATYPNGAGSVSVAIENTTTTKWWNGSSFATATQTFVAATGTTNWTYAIATSKFASGNSYTVVVKPFDAIGNSAASAPVAFTINTTAPAPAVSYPVASTTYGANWTGNISGTATFINGAGSVAAAIQNTTSGMWWNGSTFSASSQTFVPATGTTSWSVALTAGNLTSGSAYSITPQAIDSLGNVGLGAARTFTYNTTAPVATVTYPVSNATYGSDYTGTLKGTATFTNTASGVKVSIQNNTTSKWWNGTNFTSSSQVLLSASGTTNWTYSLPVGNLAAGNSYAVTAVATDTAGNSGISTSQSFTYAP